PVLGQLASSLISGSSEQAKEQRAEAAKMREMQMAHELNRPLNEAQIRHLGAQSAALSQPEYGFFEGGPGQPYGTMNNRTGELNLKGITPAPPHNIDPLGPEGQQAQIAIRTAIENAKPKDAGELREIQDPNDPYRTVQARIGKDNTVSMVGGTSKLKPQVQAEVQKADSVARDAETQFGILQNLIKQKTSTA